ncbi:MAG: B3/4 domain-containing protein [Thermoplasmatota archaeon]
MHVQVDESVQPLGVDLSTDIMEGIEVRGSRREAFRALAGELKLEMRERFGSLDLVRDDATVKAFRKFYWRIGIDPTKTRPSSEALLRRLLKKEPPMINNLVDAGNLASARTIIPIGIYDLDRIVGEPLLRTSLQGEEFQGIGGKVMTLSGNVPVFADEAGIIHLYPHRDSMRTRVTENCRRALVVACGAPGIKKKMLDRALEEVKYYFRQLEE